MSLLNRNIWLILIILIIIYMIILYYYDNNDNNISYDTQMKYNIKKKIYISPLKKTKSLKKILDKKLENIKVSNKNNYSIPIIKKINIKYYLKYYFATWCPHCNTFKPIWDNHKDKYNNIEFIEIDCSNKDPNLPYIDGYPTIVLFDKDDNLIEIYNNKDNFENFLNKINT